MKKKKVKRMTNSSLVVFLMDYINLELEQLHRRNKIGPTCNPQTSTWMIASCSRRFGVLGGKDPMMIFGKLISRYSSAFETTQTLQPRDRGPERPVRVCTSPDSWQLVIIAKGFWQASSK
nr:hypothetical protein CFP56_58091 [Quercus suber]